MESDFTFIIIIGILILISAFFSGSETALMSSSKPKLHSLEKDSDSAKLVNKLLNNPGKLLSTILLGNNLVNIAASALATVLFTNMFGASGVVYATLIMTVVVLIFAEVLPKTIASIYPENIAMAIAYVMNVISIILCPFTKTINCITNLMMKLLKVNTKKGSFFDEQDIKGAISLGLKTGILKRGEHRMLDSIVALDSITAEEVMQHRSKIESLSIDLSVDEIFAEIQNSTHSRIPIFKDKETNIIGILYLRDFFPCYAKALKANKTFKLQDILKPAMFIPESAPLSDILIDFRKTFSHIRLVVNEYGNLVGILTLEDILEEIVGEIVDEHDSLETKYQKAKDGSVIISGFNSIRDCNRDFAWDIPEDDHITLGGFIASIAEELPQTGDIIEYNNWKFEVLNKTKQAIVKLKVTKIN